MSYIINFVKNFWSYWILKNQGTKYIITTFCLLDNNHGIWVNRLHEDDAQKLFK